MKELNEIEEKVVYNKGISCIMSNNDNGGALENHYEEGKYDEF